MIHIDCMVKGVTITSHYYIENYLKRVLEEINKQRPTSGRTNVKLLHDNARPDVQKDVKSFVKNSGLTLICHPPYSPDLAPSDFWLFDRIKSHLDDHANVKPQKRQITNILEEIPREDYKNKHLRSGCKGWNFVY